MLKPVAQTKRLGAFFVWAPLGAFYITAISSCLPRDSSDRSINIEEGPNGQCLLIENEQKPLNRALVSEGKPPKPMLFAHFLQQSLMGDIGIADVINAQDDGESLCGPGPFLTEPGVIIGQDKDWELSHMPDFFIWHLEAQSSGESRFYITDHTGLPIKATSLRLEDNNKTALILIPKISLPNTGHKFFIYQVIKEISSDKPMIFVQPIRKLERQVASNS